MALFVKNVLDWWQEILLSLFLVCGDYGLLSVFFKAVQFLLTSLLLILGNILFVIGVAVAANTGINIAMFSSQVLIGSLFEHSIIAVVVKIDISLLQSYVDITWWEGHMWIISWQSSPAVSAAVVIVVILFLSQRWTFMDVIVDERLTQFVFDNTHRDQILDAFCQKVFLQNTFNRWTFLGVFIQHFCKNASHVVTLTRRDGWIHSSQNL